MSETVSGREDHPVRDGYKRVHLGPQSVQIPEEWEILDLQKLATNSGSYGANASAVDADPDLPRYIRITDISEHGLLKDDDIVSIERDDAEGHFLNEGDLLFARTGATVGKSYLHRQSDREAAYAGYLIRYEVDESRADPEFLWNYTQSKLYDDWIERITRHGAQENVNASEYRRLDVITPPLPEQRHIAAVLSTVDEQIRETEEIIKTTKELKQGLLQDVFSEGTLQHDSTAETPIGEFPADWTLERVGDRTELISGTHVKSDLVTADPSQTPYLTGPDDFDGIRFEVTKYTDSPVSFCEPDDTLVTVKGMGCGNSVLADSRACISRQLKALRSKDDLDPTYLFYWIRYNEKNLRILAEGTRQLGLSNSDLETFPLPVPTLEEQQLIGDSIWAVETRLQSEREYKQKLQTLKRGLMQDLLTGQVRTPPDLSEDDTLPRSPQEQ